MSLATHQTIKLSRGKHRSSEDGACVMELASMLAGEAFSDHPVAVCPVIGAFLRAYNDSVDDRHRQDLYAYASKVVGSRLTAEVEEARITHLNVSAEHLRPRRRRFPLPRRLRSLSWGLPIEGPAARVVHELVKGGEDRHEQALALIDELLEVGAAKAAAPAVTETPGLSSRRVGPVATTV